MGSDPRPPGAIPAQSLDVYPIDRLPLPGLAIGDRAADSVPLGEVAQRQYCLGDFARGRVLVLGFLGNACPAVKALTADLVGLPTKFGSQGVEVVAINSNNSFLSPRDAPNEMVLWAEQNRLTFPYLKDPEGHAAKFFGARNTPQFVVLDQERRLRYRGRMFDSREPARASTRDLEAAIVAVLAGRTPEPPETSPLGCSIVW